MPGGLTLGFAMHLVVFIFIILSVSYLCTLCTIFHNNNNAWLQKISSSRLTIYTQICPGKTAFSAMTTVD